MSEIDYTDARDIEHMGAAIFALDTQCARVKEETRTIKADLATLKAKIARCAADDIDDCCYFFGKDSYDWLDDDDEW